VKRLVGEQLRDALVSGIHRVIAEQDELNRINVFPVADGDTGTNLSLSVGAALPALENDASPHLGTLLAALADTLLDASRGNSGAILAQFFLGVSDAVGEREALTTYTFGKAVAAGAEFARSAIAEPREGTMLSVIAAFGRSVRQQVADDNQEDFRPLFGAALAAVEEALAKTPEQLDVLRRAGVVDAGAQGFVALVSGMTGYVRDGRITERPDRALTAMAPAFEQAASPGEAGFRYCIECIVSAADIDRRKLREELSAIGDSVVVAGTARKAKVHAHADDPEAVFSTARRYGGISSEKADDMRLQQESSHDETRRFAVITDSAADISDADIEALDIHVVPLRIQFGEHAFLDKVSLTNDAFFERLATSDVHPTTSQPALGDFRRQFQFLASHYADVVSISVSARASGTFQAAQTAARHVDAAGRIHTIDSRNASLGQGQLVVHAARAARDGRDVESTLDAVQALIPATQSFAIIGDLGYAVRGGRVPGWVKSVADLLNLVPVIRTVSDGRVATAGFLFGRRDRLRKFSRFVSRRAIDGPVALAVGHAACPDDAQQLETRLREALGTVVRSSVTEIGAAFGVHGGPNTIVVALQPARDADDGSV